MLTYTAVVSTILKGETIMQHETYYQIVQNMQELYHSLGDEQSKELFLARLECDLTMGSLDISPALARLTQWTPWVDSSRGTGVQKLEEVIRSGKKLIYYGAGEMGMCHYYDIKRTYGATPVAFCDGNPEKWGSRYCGLPVISPETLLHEYSDAVAIISNLRNWQEIREFLLKKQFPDEHVLVLPGLFDPDQYWRFLKKLRWSRGGAFVDAGCRDGKDSVRFAEMCANCAPPVSYSKIIAFEPSPRNAEDCRRTAEAQNLHGFELKQLGLGKAPEKASFMENLALSTIRSDGEVEVEIVPLDSLTTDTDVMLIKMDIEGSEFDALLGAKETILRCRPVLAICVYHKCGDLLAIFSYLKDLCKEYNFYIRQAMTLMSETVLYAVPIEMDSVEKGEL